MNNKKIITNYEAYSKSTIKTAGQSQLTSQKISFFLLLASLLNAVKIFGRRISSMSITGDFLDTFDILRESDIKGCVHYIFVGLF